MVVVVAASMGKGQLWQLSGSLVDSMSSNSLDASLFFKLPLVQKLYTVAVIRSFIRRAHCQQLLEGKMEKWGV